VDTEHSHEHLGQEIADVGEQVARGKAEVHRLRAERRRLLARQASLKARKAKLEKQVAKLTARAVRLGLVSRTIPDQGIRVHRTVTINHVIDARSSCSKTSSRQRRGELRSAKALAGEPAVPRRMSSWSTCSPDPSRLAQSTTSSETSVMVTEPRSSVNDNRVD